MWDYLKVIWFEVILVLIVFMYIPVIQALTSQELNNGNRGFTTDLLGESSLEEVGTIVVEVSGGVLLPGIYSLPDNSRIHDLINVAEGYTDDADVFWVYKNLNSARLLEDSEKLYIPYQWERYDKLGLSVSNVPLTSAVINNHNVNTEDPSTSIYINSASKEQLMSLPGIGDAYSTKIIQNRPYSDIEDFRNKSLLSPKLIDKISDKLTF